MDYKQVTWKFRLNVFQVAETWRSSFYLGRFLSLVALCFEYLSSFFASSLLYFSVQILLKRAIGEKRGKSRLNQITFSLGSSPDWLVQKHVCSDWLNRTHWCLQPKEKLKSDTITFGGRLKTNRGCDYYFFLFSRILHHPVLYHRHCLMMTMTTTTTLIGLSEKKNLYFDWVM